MNAQREGSAAVPDVKLDWENTVGGAATDEKRYKAEFLVALQRTALAYQGASAPAGEKYAGEVSARTLEVIESGRGTKVIATSSFPARSLVLVPLVRDVNKVSTAASSPLRIPVPGLREAGWPLCILPDVAKNGPQPFLPPFWLVPRTATPGLANLSLDEVVMDLGGYPTVKDEQHVRPPARNLAQDSGYIRQWRMPVAVNPTDISAGTELKLLSPALPTREAAAAKRTTWKDAVKGKAGKPEGKAMAKK